MKKFTPFLVPALGFVLGMGCGSAPVDQNVVFWDTALLQSVTRITDDGLWKDYAKVSPDGTRLLYCESTKTVQRTDLGGYYAYWNIFMLRDVNVAAKTPLINDYAYAPAWYENNTNFLYVISEGGQWKLVRSSTAGGGRTFVTRNPVARYDFRPTIRNGVILCDSSPSSTVENDDSRQIYSMRENGTEVTILGQGHSPAWHPTEPKFVFIRKDDVYEMDLATTQVTLLFSDQKYKCALPSYSWDGKYILFQKGAVQKVTGTAANKVGGFFKKIGNVVTEESRWHIFIMKADGSELSPLTSGNVDVYSPSMDMNNTVYFVANATGKTEIYRARVNFN